ncbi:glycosyltransferase family 2 protein [Marinilabiliaceae bacterium JC017]|nr:glycosyltransferase family 2 protein [Marinilabiliaceae bacterium JC017]
MQTLEIIFWILLFLLFYTYLGYGMVLYLMVRIKRWLRKAPDDAVEAYEPEVTLLVAAFNEKEMVKDKVSNTCGLDYPAEKLKQVWVTDGSDDGTDQLLKDYADVTVLHQPERQGKIAAINRAMPLVDTSIVIFSDANTFLGEESVRRIVNLFRDKQVGCVSGEKRIYSKAEDAAAGAGEGIYWRYESTLKRWDAELNTVVGAAGELFAIRTELFEAVEPDTLLDDFIISLRIAAKGYTVQYDPEAYAIETASANVEEELKRKVRIAAGGIQSIVRLRHLMNVFRYGLLAFQFISHRVLRWTLAPLAIPLVFVLNYLLCNDPGISWSGFYQILFFLQVVFYALAIAGIITKNQEVKLKILFVPYYFLMMNYAVYLGLIRYLKKSQSVNWERARRGVVTEP